MRWKPTSVPALAAICGLSASVVLAEPLVGFRVDFGGQDKGGFKPGDYSALAWSGVQFDLGKRFSTNGIDYIPVKEGEPPGIMGFGGEVWISGNANSFETGKPPNAVLKLFKNGDCQKGTAIPAAIGVPSKFTETFVITLSAHDYAKPGDTYRACLFVTDKDAVVDGNVSHTYWSGSLVR